MLRMDAPSLKIWRSSSSRARPFGNPFLRIQIVSKWRILDSRRDDFRRRFQLHPPQVLNHTTDGEHPQRFCSNLEIFEKIDFLKSSGAKHSPPGWGVRLPKGRRFRVWHHFWDCVNFWAHFPWFIIDAIMQEWRPRYQKVHWCVSLWFYPIIAITTWDTVDISLDFPHFGAFVNLGTWCEVLFTRNKIFGESESPPIAGPDTSDIQISEIKLYPNEGFSIPIRMIFNVDSKCVHPRFWIRALKVAHRHDFVRILRFLWESISWNQILWSLAVSDLIPGDSWYHRKSPSLSWFIFKIIDF